MQYRSSAARAALEATATFHIPRCVLHRPATYGPKTLRQNEGNIAKSLVQDACQDTRHLLHTAVSKFSLPLVCGIGVGEEINI